MSDEQPTGRRVFHPSLIVAILIGLGLVAFIVQNTSRTKVRWLFLTVHAPLWVVILIAGAATLVIAEITGFVVRRARKS
jgi:uncharacterized integral membrane protein